MRGSRPLTEAEIHQVAESFRGRFASRNYALFLLGINTGFRIHELLSLRVGDLVRRDGSLTDRVTVQRRNMKGKRSSRNIILNSAAREAVRPWLLIMRENGYFHKDDFLFYSGRNDTKPLSICQAWGILTESFKRCGLHGKLGTHCMRKTFANFVYNEFKRDLAAGKNVDPFRATSKALGHAVISTTDKYLSFQEDDLDDVILRIGL